MPDGTEPSWNADMKASWVQELRSGKYVQGIGTFYEDGKHCAVGVLRQTARAGGLRMPKILYDAVVRMNDEEGKTFEEIADWLENNPV